MAYKQYWCAFGDISHLNQQQHSNPSQRQDDLQKAFKRVWACFTCNTFSCTQLHITESSI